MKNSVICLGNPVIDAYAFVEDSFLTENGLVKGDVPVLSVEKVKEISSKLNIVSMSCGGSGSNMVKAMGFLGHDVGLLGQYGDDEYGKVVKDTLEKYNVKNLSIVKKGGITTQIFTLITPDAQRTMTAIFGASHEIKGSDLNTKLLDDYGWILVEGYQFCNENLTSLVDKSIEYSKSINQKIIVAYSSIFCANSYKKQLTEISKSARIISGTMEEFMVVFDKKDDEEMLSYLEKQSYDVCVVTMGSKGAYAVSKGKRTFIPAPIVKEVVDTTGAGDSFFGGFLYGFLNGCSVETSGRLGSLLAGNVISHVGTDIDEAVKEESKILLSRS